MKTIHNTSIAVVIALLMQAPAFAYETTTKTPPSTTTTTSTNEETEPTSPPSSWGTSANNYGMKAPSSNTSETTQADYNFDWKSTYTPASSNPTTGQWSAGNDDWNKNTSKKLDPAPSDYKAEKATEEGNKKAADEAKFLGAETGVGANLSSAPRPLTSTAMRTPAANTSLMLDNGSKFENADPEAQKISTQFNERTSN